MLKYLTVATPACSISLKPKLSTPVFSGSHTLPPVVMQCRRDLAGDFYKHYKYYHFYAICVCLGSGAAFYSPFRSLMVPSVLAVFFTIVFEIMGIITELPAQTKRCKGPPYDKRDVCWGFCFALFMAILNLHLYHVYTLSYGCGIIVFALRGAKRKYSSLWKLREGEQPWW